MVDVKLRPVLSKVYRYVMTLCLPKRAAVAGAIRIAVGLCVKQHMCCSRLVFQLNPGKGDSSKVLWKWRYRWTSAVQVDCGGIGDTGAIAAVDYDAGLDASEQAAAAVLDEPSSSSALLVTLAQMMCRR